MISKMSLTLLAGAMIVSAGVAYAAAGGDEAIKARMACMKANGGGMGVMVPMIKGEKPYDAAAVKTATDSMAAACANWKDFWPADSMKPTDPAIKSRATEAVWKDPKAFEEQGNAYYTAFTALAASKDEAGFKATFGAVGKACGACHEKNRAPEQN